MTDDFRANMPATAAAAAFTRALIKRRLGKWDCGGAADDVLVVAAELLSNAVKATPGRPIRVLCRREDDTVRIAVWDSSPERPAPARRAALCLDDLDVSEDDFDANGGRGLHIVDALAAEWGYRPDPADPSTGRLSGKWAWARVRVP